jgi:hypothetical protein
LVKKTGERPVCPQVSGGKNGDSPVCPRFLSDSFWLPIGLQVPKLVKKTGERPVCPQVSGGKNGDSPVCPRFLSVLSTIGRFMTPDWAAKPTSVPYANFGDPQTLNLYAFVGDNPVNRVDPDGHRNDEWIKPYAKGAGFDVDGPGSADIAMVEAANTLLLLARASEAQNNSTQQPALVPLSKDVNYTVANNGPNAPEVHAVFSPETADHLNAAFKELNKDGITPQINSAFRTDSDQAYMQSGGSGTNPAAKVSWHQAGAAVDINGTRSPEFKTIISVMKKNGFVWGGDFKSHKDPPHFDGRQFMGNLNQAVRKAQSYWDSTQ